MWFKSIFSHSVGCHFTLLLPLLSRIFFFFGLYHLLVIFFFFFFFLLLLLILWKWWLPAAGRGGNGEFLFCGVKFQLSKIIMFQRSVYDILAIVSWVFCASHVNCSYHSFKIKQVNEQMPLLEIKLVLPFLQMIFSHPQEQHILDFNVYFMTKWQ